MTRRGFRRCLLPLLLAPAVQPLPVPRDVYTYWHSGALPDVVARCMETWREHCKGCKIHLITSDNVGDYVAWRDAWSRYRLEHQSDLVRAEVLTARGGIYLDATVAAADGSFFDRVFAEAESGAIVGFDLDLDFQSVDFQRGLRTGDWSFIDDIRPAPQGDPRRIFENWGFGAAQGSPSMRLWRDEFLLALGESLEGAEAYSSRWKERFAGKGGHHETLAGWLPYLLSKAAIVSAAARGGLQLSLQPAEETALLYLRYVPSPLLTRLMRPADYWMDGTGMPIFALGRSSAATPGPPAVRGLVKFRGLERDTLRHVIACRAYALDSPLRALLGLQAVPAWWPVGAVQLMAGFSILLEREKNLPCRVLSQLLQGLLQLLARGWWPFLLFSPLLLPALRWAGRRLRGRRKTD